MIYLDHNATTPIDQRVLDAMMPFLTTFYGNASGLYRMGRVVRTAIDTAREQVAALVDVQPAQVIFTSGGTEANNLVLNTLLTGKGVAVSSTDHPSVIEPARHNKHSECSFLPVDELGLLALTDLQSLLDRSKVPDLVSVMLANNETGVIQDISSISEFFKNTSVLLHSDAVQGIGKIPVSFNGLGVDFMTLSSHKIYGPKGCGALIINKDIAVTPLIIGGGQENQWRAGTENVAAIVGFGKAAELALLELEANAEYLFSLRALLEKQLKTIPDLVIFAESIDRLPNTVQFGLSGVDGEMLQMQLDKNNIAVSSGSACSSGGGKPSSVLTAMGIDLALAKSAIRVSLGKSNTEQEINQFIDVLKSIVIKK